MKSRLGAAMLAGLILSGTATADTIGKWNRGDVDGFTRYWTTNSDGASFVIWCHPQRKINGTLLHVEIGGKTPKPNTRIKLIMDREILELPINDHGYVDSGCPTCSDSFGYVWHKLRSSHTLAVKYQDNSYAGFSLRGAQEIIPGPVCPTDWQKSHPRS
ncbi:hypothetical protein [Roseibium sp. M-1]